MAINRDWVLEIGIDQILRGQGIDPQIGRGRERLLAAAEWALREGMPLIKPAVVCETLDVLEARHERLRFQGGLELTGRLVVDHLAGARQVVVMVCTLGSGLEESIAGWMERDPRLGMALEGFGIAAIETLAGTACQQIDEQAALQGRYTSIPLGPGMVGWPVSTGQKQIFQAVDGKAAGVQVNDSSMMTPRLSLTQVIGIGNEPLTTGKTCDYCDLRSKCRYQDHYSQASSPTNLLEEPTLSSSSKY